MLVARRSILTIYLVVLVIRSNYLPEYSIVYYIFVYILHNLCVTTVLPKTGSNCIID